LGSVLISTSDVHGGEIGVLEQRPGRRQRVVAAAPDREDPVVGLDQLAAAAQ
jgi:hypothetical protein